jgi:hypothetical protein
MSDNSKSEDQEEGDEVLRRLLKTPPDPKPRAVPIPKAEKDEKSRGASKQNEVERRG